VLELKPQLQERLERLSGDHHRFRTRLGDLLPELHSLSESEEASFYRVCEDLRQLLDDLDCHDQQEVELLQQSLLEDEGGEG